MDPLPGLVPLGRLRLAYVAQSAEHEYLIEPLGRSARAGRLAVPQACAGSDLAGMPGQRDEARNAPRQKLFVINRLDA